MLLKVYKPEVRVLYNILAGYRGMAVEEKKELYEYHEIINPFHELFYEIENEHNYLVDDEIVIFGKLETVTNVYKNVDGGCSIILKSPSLITKDKRTDESLERLLQVGQERRKLLVETPVKDLKQEVVQVVKPSKLWFWRR